MTHSFYSYFRGGGGAELGAEQVGYTSVGGVEFEPAIAAACDVNFAASPTTVADVCAVQPENLLDAAPGWFHASPSCRNASQANSDAGETDEDREAGKAVARFVRHWLPERVTVENVWQYRNFDAFGYILQALRDSGYSFDYWHLNAADYGVPQTRKRLILVAKRGEWRIQRPEPTHRNGGDMFLPAWNGWYSAIQDLIPTLPESKFAAWQLARLPAEFVGSFYTIPQQSDDKKGEGVGYGCPRRSPLDPALTVTATQSAGWYKAFIVDGTASDRGERVTVPNCDEPMMTVTANGDKRKMRAFLVNGTSDAGLRDADEPCQTVEATVHSKAAMPRVFLMRSQNSQQEGSRQVRYNDDPAMTITAEEKPRAFLIGGANTSEEKGGPGVGVSEAHEPTWCVNASNSNHWRAWLDQGRVVSMTPRALSVFQSFPRTYILPEKASLACKIIGNACPPLLIQRIGESLD